MPYPQPVNIVPIPAKRDSVYAELARLVELKVPNKAISEKMGIALPEINRLLAQQDFRTYLEHYQNTIVYRNTDDQLAQKLNYIEKIERKLAEKAPLILNQIYKIATNENANDNARLKACIYWLSMAGLKGIQTGDEDKKVDVATITQLQVVLNESNGIKSKVYSGKDVRIKPETE
jgi:hypothetical protein